MNRWIKRLWKWIVAKEQRQFLFSFSLSLTSILISLFSLVFSSQANNLSNQIAKEANKISVVGNTTQDKMLALVTDENTRQRIDRSEQLANETLNELDTHGTALEDIKLNRPVKDIHELGYIVDRFEFLGDKFCNQIIERETIRVKFYYLLNNICNNNQIYSFYGGRKNGTALICYEYFPESLFAQTVKKNTFDLCKALTSK